MISILPLLFGAATLAGAPTKSTPTQIANPNLVTSLTGAMTVYRGTLVASVTPSNTAQTVKLLNGTTTTTITGCLVVGAPTSYSGYTAGSPFVVIKTGSAPFSSNFTTTTMVADVPSSYTPATSRRTVTMSTTGTLSASLGFPVSDYGGYAAELLYPPCTSSGYNFANGVVVYLGSFPASYNIAWPSTSSSPTAVVNYPATDYPPFSFSFSAKGPKNNMLIGGSGTIRALNIVSTVDAAGSVFYATNFYIGQSLTYGY